MARVLLTVVASVVVASLALAGPSLKPVTTSAGCCATGAACCVDGAPCCE